VGIKNDRILDMCKIIFLPITQWESFHQDKTFLDSGIGRV